jgi:autotransporter-associated beta strand protein
MSGGTFNALSAHMLLGWDGNAYVTVSGGTMNLAGINENSGRNNVGYFTLTGGRLNLGSLGITNDASNKSINFGAATVGANANWTGNTPINLTDLAAGTTFNTLDATDGTTARTITISGAVSGVGSLVKDGAGTLNLSGANTFTGNTSVSSGTLSLLNTSALAGSTFTGGAGSLVFDSTVVSNAFTFGGLSGTKNIALANNAGTPAAVALTIGGNNASTLYTGVLSGSGSLVKTGTGTLTLGGANTYTGVTTVGSSGTLALDFTQATAGTSNLISTGALTLNNTATLSLLGKASTANSQTFASTTLGAQSATNVALTSGTSGSTTVNFGAITRAAGSVLNLTGPTSGGFTISGRSAGIINDSSTGAAFVTLNGTSWASVDDSGNVVANATNVSGDTSLSGNVNLTGNTRLNANSTTTGISITGGAYTLQNGGYTVATGGILTSQTTTISGAGALSARVAGGEFLINTTAGVLTIASPIADNTSASTLIKQGAGAVNLTGYNTYTGSTTINAGILQVGGAGVLGGGSYAGAIAIGSGTTLGIATSANQTLSGVISGSGALVKSGTGTLTLGAANTYTGNITVNAGILTRSAGANFGVGNTAVSKITINSGGTVDINGLAGTYGYTIAGTGALGTGALINTGGDPGTGQAQMSALALSANASLGGTGNFGLLSSGYGANTLTLNGYTLTKVGSNQFYLATSTVTSGTVDIAAGQIYMHNGSSSGAAASWVLQNVSANNQTGGAALNLNNQAFSVGSLSGGGLLGGNINLGTATLTVGALNTNTTYAGKIFGTGAVTKTGTGTLTLSGAQSWYSGKTTIGGGTVSVSQIGLTNVASALGTNSTIDLTAATSTLLYTGIGESTNKVINYNSGSAGGFFTNNGTGTLTFVSAFTSAATGAYGVTFGGTGNTVMNTITQTATPYLINFNKNDSGSLTVTGALNLNGGALRAQGGTLTLASTSSNTSGATAFTLEHSVGGTLRILSSGIFSGTVATSNVNGIAPGWITYNDNTWAVLGAANTNAITGYSAFTTAQASMTATTNDDITGATALSVGANSLRFNTAAANTLTFTGTNTIASGGILVTSAVGANTSTITGGTINGPATTTGRLIQGDLVVIQNNTAGSLVIGSVIANNTTGTLTKAGAGVLSLTGVNTYTGATYINQGTLSIDGAGQLNSGSYAGNIIDNGAFIYNSSANQTLSGVISAAGTLSVTGNGNLTLSGANTYTGATTVSAGTLTLGANNTIGSTGALNLAGGTLAMGAYSAAAGAVNITGAANITGTGTLTGTSYTASNTSGTATIAANLAGSSAGLTKTGAGTLTLQGTNTYGGATSIADGTLNLDFSATGAPATNIIAATQGVTLNNRGTLQLTGKASTTNSQTLSSLTLNGATQVTLTANATANPLALNVGTLTRNAGSTLNINQPTGTISATNGVILSATNTNGIIGGWATVNGTDWAVANTGSGVTALASYTSDTWNTTNNVTVTTSSTQTLVTANSLRFNAAGANTVTLAGSSCTIATGGILVTSNVGNNLSTIAGGTLRAGLNTDLFVNQNNTANSLTISSVIGANGTNALIKSGAGQLNISGYSTYTGGTIINQGTVSITGGGGATGTLSGTGAVTVNSGATFKLEVADSLGYSSGTNTINLVGGTLMIASGNQGNAYMQYNLTGGTITGNASQNIDFGIGGTSTSAINTFASATSSVINTITLGNRSTSGIVFNVADGAAAIDLDVASAIVLKTSGGGITKTGAGTMRFYGANTYVGTTNVNRGTLIEDFSASVGATNLIASGNALALNGGTFQLTGKSATVNSQTTTGLTVGRASGGSGASTINLNQNGATSLALTVGAITRNIGSTLNIVQTGTPGAAQGVITTTANVNGIIGGYATVNGTDWAVQNASSGITALGSYTLQSGTWAKTANMDVQADVTVGSGLGANTIRFNTARAGTLTLVGTNFIGNSTGTANVGGILVSSNVGAFTTTITGGTITTGLSTATSTTTDLVINHYGAGVLNIASVMLTMVVPVTRLQ